MAKIETEWKILIAVFCITVLGIIVASVIKDNIKDVEE